MAEINCRKRGDKWEYRFEGARVDGKRKQFSKGGFRTKKDALEAGTKALAEYNRSGTVFEPSTISVADYLDYWFETYGMMNLKYNSQLGYLKIIEKHLKPRFGHYRLTSLQTSAIQEFANDLKLNGLAKNSVVGIISTLSAALNYAVEPLHYIQYNPCNNIRYPKYDHDTSKDKRYVISPEDFKRIIERFPPGNTFHLPLMIGYYTGLRISEAFALTWDDIDMEKRIISVDKITVKRNFGIDVRRALGQKGKQEERSSWYFSSPKTYSSKRKVNFGETLYQAFLYAQNQVKANEEKYGEYYTDIFLKSQKDEKGNDMFKLIEVSREIPCSLPKARMLCVRENGQYISTDSFKYASRVIHYELKIAFNYHSLRHTHATMLIESGASVKSVQTRLGHNDIATTLNTYVHNTEEMANDTVDIFEKAVSNN